MDIKSYIRTVVDYPQPGIRFRDITPLLKDPEAFRFCIDRICQRYQNTALDAVASVESRGFFFGSIVAYLLGVPLVPMRKQGKLPVRTLAQDYELEYGANRIEMHADAVEKDQRIVLIDDLIATGGTVQAAKKLLDQAGANLIECMVVIELTDLGGRAKVSPLTVHSLITFTEDEL